MREQDIVIHRLLPVEPVLFTTLREMNKMTANVDALPKSAVIQYKDDYIVCDGNNRIVAHLRAGRNIAPCKIFETDEEIMASNEGLFRWIGSIKSVIRHYENGLKRDCVANGIYNFYNLQAAYEANPPRINIRKRNRERSDEGEE